MSRRRNKIRAAQMARGQAAAPQSLTAASANRWTRIYGAADGGILPGAHVPTLEEIRSRFGPPRTLGARPEDSALAMDSRLEASGFYSLVQHAFAMGQPPQGGGFLGYPELALLKQNGFISACVETVADDMLREWIEFEDVRDDGDDADADAETAIANIEKAVKGFGLQNVFLEAVMTARYFGGCLVYIDTGAADPETLKTPLNISDKSGELRKGRLRGFKVVEPGVVSPGPYNCTNPLAHDYFEPQSWLVMGREVHASRFIKISTGDVPVLLRPSYNFFGIPAAQTLWDYVLHFQNDRVATSRMLGKYSDFVFKTEGLRDLLTLPGGTAELDRRISVMAQERTNDGVAVIDKDREEIVKIESNLGGLTDITRQDLEIICAINRTPAVKLLGISPSGFNATGESDIKNYNDLVSTMQEKILRKGLGVALDCIQLHVSGRIDASVAFKFRELGGEDRQIESGIRKTNADALAAFVAAEVLTPEGARAAIEANPEEYPTGFADAVKADRERMEAEAENEVESLLAGGEEQGEAAA